MIEAFVYQNATEVTTVCYLPDMNEEARMAIWIFGENPRGIKINTWTNLTFTCKYNEILVCYPKDQMAGNKEL